MPAPSHCLPTGADQTFGRLQGLTMHPELIGRMHRFVQLESLVDRLVAEGDVWFARLDNVAEHVRPILEGRT